MTKIILISGGSISGIGKGLIASSIGSLLTNVTFLKIDPYFNYDAGTLGPSEHGEVFVLKDGTECDLDLGNYQRFCNITDLSQQNTLTTGKLFQTIFENEKCGKYLGKTIQIVPQVTNIFKEWIHKLGKNKDYIIIELGGTVGDLENTHFIASLQRLNHPIFHIHVSLVPCIHGEYKTKLVQTSVQAFIHDGLKPDLIVSRSDKQLSDQIIDKIQDRTMIPTMNVWNVDNIYNIPCQFKKLKQFFPNINIPFPLKEFSKTISIDLFGKYSHPDAYHSLTQSLYLSARKLGISLEFTQNPICDGIIVPGGFGERGVDAKIKILKYARENKIPCLGICLGMQCMALEYHRNVLGNTKASSEEFGTGNYVVKQFSNKEMRRGDKVLDVEKSSILYEIYQQEQIKERFRNKYYVDDTIGFQVSSRMSDTCPSSIELTREEHPFYIGVQYHPEFSSTFQEPNNMFIYFLKKLI
jgi:CTP synthase